jgi:hypothetical protein
VVVARDEARMALDALDAMHPRQAALLWAREVEGQSYEDLCARFDMSEPAVRSVLTRARKALRKEYNARGGTLPVGGLAILAPWVAGLGWADRARRAAARLTAPAALSAVGITALGGLVLSPFGVLPHQGTPTYRPATAVVTTPAFDVAHHATRLAAPAAPAKAAAPTTTHRGGVDGLAQHIRKSSPCINDTDSDDGHSASVALPTTDTDPSAGSSSCDGFEATPGSTIWLTPTLPDNPTGLRQVGITSNDITCSDVAAAPLVSCSPENTQPGAPK